MDHAVLRALFVYVMPRIVMPIKLYIPISIPLIFLAFCTSGIISRANATDHPQHPFIYKGIIGVVAHDRGPLSDGFEHGTDPNFEIQFMPPNWSWWSMIGSPYPTVGMTPNFNGETSAAYASLTYEASLANDRVAPYVWGVNNDMFLTGGIGATIHNGPLHKDTVNCQEDSDCGFGHRVIAHLSLETGYKLSANDGIGLFIDHMSHRWVLPGENEGVDHIGLRYYFRPW
jgi:lipid A 3-O-deacylase